MMTISQLVKELQEKQQEHGDIEVVCLTLTHAFPPDLAVRKGTDDRKRLVLNS